MQTSEIGIRTPHDFHPLPWLFVLPSSTVRQVLSEAGLCVFPLSLECFLIHPYLTGDTREACPATLPMTHRWLQYLWAPTGPCIYTVVGSISLFWFDFHASVSPSSTINSLKNMV